MNGESAVREGLPDSLVSAIVAAGEDLRGEGWEVSDGGDGPATVSDCFVQIVGRHVLPLLDTEGWRTSRIAALKAELARLEGDRFDTLTPDSEGNL